MFSNIKQNISANLPENNWKQIEIIRTKIISSYQNTKKIIYQFLKIKRQIKKKLISQRKDNTNVKI